MAGIRWSQIDHEEFLRLFVVKDSSKLVPNKLVIVSPDYNFISTDYDISELETLKNINDLLKNNEGSIGTAISKDYKDKEELDSELNNTDSTTEKIINEIINQAEDDVLTTNALIKLLTIALKPLTIQISSQEATEENISLKYQPLVYSDNSEAGLDYSNKIFTIYTFKGATAINKGIGGLVPSPVAGDNTKYLRGDGTWSEISFDNITLNNVKLIGTSISETPNAESNDDTIATTEFVKNIVTKSTESSKINWTIDKDSFLV